jgi:hypothetical protein
LGPAIGFVQLSQRIGPIDIDTHSRLLRLMKPRQAFFFVDAD